MNFLTPEKMKLPESPKRKITKDRNGKNLPHLEITEVGLVHGNIVKNGYQKEFQSLVYIHS